MCGIVGIFSFSGPERLWSSARMKSMIEKVAHRGPDGCGEWAEAGIFLGHSRLAVLDLTEAGHQPMHSRDQRFVVSYNGEIYNFRALQRELEESGERFVTATDTEVLLAAWRYWGIDCIVRLEGIFAFAVFDRQERKLFLVRDHLGVKPLHYMISERELSFASEPLALFCSEAPVPALDPYDLDAYFTFNYLPAPRTGLKGVCQLPAGHLLTVQSGGTPRLQRYWSPPCDEVTNWNLRLVEDFAKMMGDSVRAQMVSDVPLGLFLSGGLDSYAVALSSVTTGSRPMAFTLGFESPKHDERGAASDYAEYLGIPHKKHLFEWSRQEVLNTLDSMKELHADASCFPIHQLCRRARKDVTVILAGDGGDELLAGYDTYRAGDLTPTLRLLPEWLRCMLRKGAAMLPSDSERYGKRMVLERLLDATDAGPRRDHASFRRIFWERDKSFLYDEDFLALSRQSDPIKEYANLMDEVPAERSYLFARQYADIIFHLPSILAKVDRMSMACGLEVRVPLLSKSLVEFCCALPDDAKRHGGKGKRILREAVASRIPPAALKRPKAGFLPPVDAWFRHEGPMIAVFGDMLAEARAQSLPLLRWERVEEYWSRHRNGEVEGGFILLGILQYINWSFKCRL